jgi:hypothetical protein
MTNTRDMLDASPSRFQLDSATVAAAIDACMECVQSCSSCADADLAEDDVDELRSCIALCLCCADVCGVTARVLSRPAHLDPFIAHRLLQACVRTCSSCGEECGRHAAHHRHCAICEKVCRGCVEACTALLSATPFQEFQRSGSQGP